MASPLSPSGTLALSVALVSAVALWGAVTGQTTDAAEGTTRAEEVDRFPYRPTRIVDSVADLVGELEALAG